MVNKAGNPAFRSKAAFAANPGSFAIETGNDFDDGANFVLGYGAADDEGKLKALVTVNTKHNAAFSNHAHSKQMDAPANTTVNIVPATKLHIAAYSSSVGTVIDGTVLSKHAAAIDFTKNAGMYGAIVTHEANGGFSVKYTTQADFTKAVDIASKPSTVPATSPKATTSTEIDPRDAELTKLRQQM